MNRREFGKITLAVASVALIAPKNYVERMRCIVYAKKILNGWLMF